MKATFPVVHDTTNSVAEKFKVEPLPSNVVIDRSGKVVASFEGAADLKGMEAAIKKAIGK